MKTEKTHIEIQTVNVEALEELIESIEASRKDKDELDRPLIDNPAILPASKAKLEGALTYLRNDLAQAKDNLKQFQAAATPATPPEKHK